MWEVLDPEGTAIVLEGVSKHTRTDGAGGCLTRHHLQRDPEEVQASIRCGGHMATPVGYTSLFGTGEV